MTQPPDGPSAATPLDAPPAVVELATQRQLGDLRAVHGDPNPFVVLLSAGVLAGASFGLWGLITWTGLGIRALALLGLFGVVIALVMVFFAVKIMLTGARQTHLYAHGFVNRRNRRLRAVTWPEVDNITRNYGGNVLVSYMVFLRDGTRIDLPVGRMGATAKLLEAELEQLIAQAGIVTELEIFADAIRSVEASERAEGPGEDR